MPAKTQKHYQAGRTNLRRSITMSPQALADAATVSEHTRSPYLSTAIEWALRKAAEGIADRAEFRDRNDGGSCVYPTSGR